MNRHQRTKNHPKYQDKLWETFKFEVFGSFPVGEYSGYILQPATSQNVVNFIYFSAGNRKDTEMYSKGANDRKGNQKILVPKNQQEVSTV